LIIDDGGKVLTAAAHKDLSQRLTGHYQGVYATMKEHINTVVETLDSALCQVSDAVNQVESVSNQISGNAQGWAESASQQVNTLEVVSTNLEEMSTITMVNAKHSSLAKTLAAEARIAADHGDAAMKRMAEAIRQIKCSADDTAHIIKTIDDFADQTNILAMKATVEATRAGRAGKGFAMVADEVRKLAIRSVEAAKNTTKMIEAAVKNADGGVKITEDVAKSFGQIVDRTNTVGYLIDEIAAASAEQARDIKMVNNSVAEMSEVTQRNADNSEESAKVSEELLDRAEELSDMVSEFKLSGGNGNAKRRPKKQNQLPSTEKSDVTPNNAANNTAKVTGGWVGTAFVKSTKILKAEDIIPLDKND
ncbi:MAG: methyl-accepting chemotaxis protein, partial [Chitinispirillales bacterium]|nr:methyl-accepting chemotaxis protein [Chitinispirillales bacterium]